MIYSYSTEDLVSILEEMASYVKSNEVGNDGYFDELVQTGLFHDAVGKPIGYATDEEDGYIIGIEVTTEY